MKGEASKRQTLLLGLTPQDPKVTFVSMLRASCSDDLRRIASRKWKDREQEVDFEHLSKTCYLPAEDQKEMFVRKEKIGRSWREKKKKEVCRRETQYRSLKSGHITIWPFSTF
ncbi:hypothetical protein Pfo_015459 [Paulownia fortunei]|nr:hypothetical protein Pfo_015459 [Paulownia fortunei]